MEAFKVGSTLELRDLAGPKLLELARIYDRVDQAASRLNKTMKLTSGSRAEFSAIGKSARALQKDLQLADTNMRKFAGNLSGMKATGPISALKGMSGELQRAKSFGADLTVELKAISAENAGLRSVERTFERMATHLTAASMRAGTLHSHMQGIITAGGAMPPMPPLPRGGGGGGRGGRGGGAGGGIHGGNMHIGPGGVGLGSIGLGLGSAAVPLVAGYMAAQGADALYEAGRDYETAFMRFKALNLGDAINTEADKFAKASKHFGVSNTEMMRVLGESVGLFGTFDEAKQFAPMISELSIANQAVFGDKLGPLDGEAAKHLIRFIDRNGGLKDHKSFQSSLDLAEQMMTGSGGSIKASDLDAFSQRAGSSFRSLTDDGKRRMAGLMIEQGGSSAGVAMMSMYQNLVAGRTPKKTMAFLQELGLGTLEMQTHGAVGGKPLRSLILKDVKDMQTLAGSPTEWVTNTLVPAIHRYEALHGLPQTDQQTVKFVNDVFSNRTGSNSASLMSTQNLQLLRDYKLTKNAMKASDVTNMFEGSSAGKQAEFEAAWSSFKSVFGEKVLPGATALIVATTGLLRYLTDFSIAGVKADVLKFNADASSGSWADKYRAQHNMGARPDWQNPDGSISVKKILPSWLGGEPSSPIAPAVSQSQTIHTTVHLDGRVIADVVSGHQARALSAPLGSGMFDPGLQQTPQTLKRW